MNLYVSCYCHCSPLVVCVQLGYIEQDVLQSKRQGTICFEILLYFSKGDSHLEPCQTRYRDMISRYRYIPILNPISGTILQIPDIGYFPISGIPISGHTRYRESRYWESPDIGNPDIGINIGIYRYRDQMSRYRVIAFPDIAHDVSCSQQAPGPGLGLAFRLLPPAGNR